MASAGGGSSLKFVVEIAADQATQGLQALQLAVNQASGAIKTSFGGIGPSARAAGHEVEGLKDKIKGFVREERGERRMASFFVRDIAEIIPVSKEAKFALTDLGGALLGGGAVGMGIAAAATLLGGLAGAFHEIGKEAEEAEKKMVKAAEESRKAWEDMRASSQSFLRDLNPDRTKSEKWLEGQTEKYSTAIEETQGALAKAEAKRAPLGGYSGASFWQYQTWADYKAAQALDAEIDRLKANLIDLEAKKTTAQRVFSEKLQPAEQAADRAKLDKDIAKAMRDADVAASNKVFEDKLERERKADEKRREERKKAAEKLAKEERDRYLYADRGFAELEAPAFGTVTLDENKIAKDKAHALKEAQEKYREELRKTAAEYEHFGHIASRTMTGLITGTMSGAQAMQYLLGAITEAVLQYFTKIAAAELAKRTVDTAANTAKVGQNAVVTGSGVTAWAAPTMGPYAIALGAAAMAAVLSEFVISGSAAKGARIPPGMNPVFQLHSGEHVIPAAIARRYEAGAPGASTEINITAIDAKSVERLFQNNGRALVRALERRQRRVRG